MKKIRGGDRPTMWGLLKTLREEDMLVRVDLRNAAVGNPPRKVTKRVYRELSARLKELCRQYSQREIDMEQMLRSVGYNIRWKAPIHHVNN